MSAVPSRWKEGGTTISATKHDLDRIWGEFDGITQGTDNWE